MEPPVTWTLHRSQGIILVGRYPGSPGLEPEHGNSVVQRNIRIVAVDLNQTLIVSKSGTLHGKDETDWKWWHESVPAKLRVLALNNYTIIISSNQGRLTDLEGNEVPEAASFKRKLEHIMRALQIPVILLVACANDLNRKPRPGLWPLIPTLIGNGGCGLDKEQSHIVGDAAGREGDFSDSDLNWAMNAGIPFSTPEEFFLGEARKARTHKFDPQWYLDGNEKKECEVGISQLQSMSMIVLVGLPGAGKTTFYHRFLRDHGFERRDAHLYNSREAFIEAVDEAVGLGIQIVIDDLNLDVETRKTWTSLASKHGITANAFFFAASEYLCIHNDTVRALGGHLMNLENRPVYPRLQFLALVPRLNEPTTSEGFGTVNEVNFKWSGTDEQLSIWKKFWI